MNQPRLVVGDGEGRGATLIAQAITERYDATAHRRARASRRAGFL